jgi:hypothetical protein
MHIHIYVWVYTYNSRVLHEGTPIRVYALGGEKINRALKEYLRRYKKRTEEFRRKER